MPDLSTHFRLVCPEINFWLPLAMDNDDKNEDISDKILVIVESAAETMRNRVAEAFPNMGIIVDVSF